MNRPFIIRLRQGFDRFDAEVSVVERQQRYEYLHFLRSIRYFDLVDLIISACTLYPRSKQECIDALTDLSFSTTNHYGLSSMRLSHRDIEDLSRTVNDIGMEVISQLEGIGFYENENDINDIDYLTAKTFIAQVSKINPFTFVVSGRVNVVSYEPHIRTLTRGRNGFLIEEDCRYLH